MHAERPVIFYFDFVSPYSWLALMQAEGFAARHDVRWVVRPVVYAALLDVHGLVGPAEAAAKRRYTFRDIVRCAHRLGLTLAGPPTHPFRSIEALRTACLYHDRPEALPLAVRLADACWGAGRALTELDTLADVLQASGLDGARLAERIGDPAVKQRLRANTDDAVARGVFGVPSFVSADELFWGHDRLDQLADHLAGRGPRRAALAEELLARPRGADRRRSPG